MIYLTFLLGPTNAGKSTFIEATKLLPLTARVEVGKQMRAKYSDPASPHYVKDYFKGNSSPTHTATEAWQMMVDGIAEAVAGGSKDIFIDGQPRDIKQCDDIQTKYGDDPDNYQVTYLNLYAPLAIRKQRSAERDKTEEARKLSEQRMEGDILKIYEVLCRVHSRGCRVITADTFQGVSYTDLLAYVVTGARIADGISCS